MKRAVIVAAVVLAMFVVPASAQVFYTYPGARVVSDVSPAVGAIIGFGEKDLVRLLGYGRFNVTEVSDFGLEIVLDNLDDWRFGAAGDFKYAIVPSENTLPFDLAVGGGIGFETGDNFTNISVPFGAIISRDLEVGDGKVIVPYGGVYIVITHVSFGDEYFPMSVPGIDRSDTDTDIELRLGGRMEITKSTGGFLTLHIGHDTMFAIGANVSL